MERITVFTPTYNRADTLERVYESLESQSYRNFCWIIVDDGSTDHTKEVVKEYIKKASFRIQYIFQQNSGKHVAINRALKETTTELFLIADSDDAFKSTSLQKFIDAWESIDSSVRSEYKGVIAKCFDPVTDEGIGSFPQYQFDSNDLDAFFKLKLRFEKWNIIRTDVMKEISFPEPEEKLKFYPETVVWWQMARKYKTRYIDENLRAYYRDQKNSLITQKSSRSRETIYLWRYYINDIMDYFWTAPIAFAKAYIGYSRDNFLSGNKYGDAIKSIKGIYRKIFVTLLYPVGILFAFKKRGK